MKIRFVRNVIVDVQKARLDEIWDKSFKRWDEVTIESVLSNPDGKTAHIITYDGDILVEVPINAFEVIR